MVLPTTIQKDPEMVQALVTSFEEASRKTYADPAFAKEVARKEFPDLPGDVVDKAIDAELKYLIPAQSVVTKPDQWKNLMEMQVYLGNAKGIDSVRSDHRQLVCGQGGRQPEMTGEIKGDRVPLRCHRRPECRIVPSFRWLSSMWRRAMTSMDRSCRSSAISA